MSYTNMKKIKFNKALLRDKLNACWLGKNIGGTIGAPFEHEKSMLDIQGFTSPPGEPLPNDDLDLQLVWLYAMEKEGPFHFDANILGEYWLSMITPYWNEYGIAKANMREGITAPLSGEMHNAHWRHSNGAWIRSEIWAGLAPGFPNIACRYAFVDATVDHGLGEGTYAEIFTATLQSEAYFSSDIRALIEKGLAAIPADCRVAKAVRLVTEEYDKGTPYREVRQMLVEQSRDIGWFQAPANLGYVTIGLLYGEGDFKKSVLYAVNCGDDTDCTGGTVGSILGIMGGTAVIPKDWAEYIGERIMTVCISAHYLGRVPKTCSEFTERILDLLPIVFYANGYLAEYTDGESELGERSTEVSASDRYHGIGGIPAVELLDRSPYSFDLPNNGYAKIRAEFDRLPFLKAGDTVKLRLFFHNLTGESYHINMKLLLPEGWTAEYPKTVSIGDYFTVLDKSEWEATVTVGEKVDAINHVIAVGKTQGHMIPIVADFIVSG